jgi:hypothetical protein
MATSSSDDFSVLVSASDLGIDATPFLANKERGQNKDIPEPENWHESCRMIALSISFLMRISLILISFSSLPFKKVDHH